MHGWNDNPTVEQFASAYRQLLVNNDVFASNQANCIETYDNILTVSSRRPKLFTNCVQQNDIIAAEENINVPEDEEDSFSLEVLPNGQSGDIDNVRKMQLHVIAYLASIIEKEIIESNGRRPVVKCHDYLRAFGECEFVRDEFLEQRSEAGDITIPCASTVVVCTAAERELQKFNYKIDNYESSIKNILASIDFKNVFIETDFDHQNNDHKMLFVTTIVKIYVRKKMNYITRTKTREKVGDQVRNQLKKTIHFKGQ